MNGLAIAYNEWSQEITYNRATYKFEKGNGIDRIRTHDGRLFKPEEWEAEAMKYVADNHLEDLLEQIKAYVKDNFAYSRKEVTHRALSCLLHESYLKWDDFVLQERLKI